MATQMLTQCLVAYSPVHHLYQVRSEQAQDELQSKIILVFYYSHTKHISQAHLLNSGIFNLSKGTEHDAFLGVATIVATPTEFLKLKSQLYKRNNHKEYSCNPI